MNCWDVLESVLNLQANRILLYGKPGLGKSYTPVAWAKACQRQVASVTLTEMTPMSELRGHFILKGQEFVWHDGTVTRMWRASHQPHGALLVLNEINEAGADTETFLHNVLDDPEFAQLHLPTGEVVTPADMMTVATMNGTPEQLRPALRDRFPIRIRIDQPNPQALATLPSTLAKAAAAMIMDSGTDLSLRAFIEFKRLVRRGGEIRAIARLLFGDAGETILSTVALEDLL